ncbi:MAG: hypothetical protein DRI69_11295 [Bacteroidetes bacterium]|nr:MAG: hypothetical protein DRI69_11295 [Bacteroidota bacterium]
MKSVFLLLFTCCILTGLQAQTHQIDIHPNNRVASLLMSMQEYGDWKTNDAYNNQGIREALFQDIYQKFSDQYDFIFLILNEDNRPDNLPFGQLIQVSNDITGLGLSDFDNTENYGSDGMLQAVIHLTQRNYLRSGPSLHELMHNWGNFGIPTESVAAPGNGLESFPFIPHWGFTGGSSRGQLGGFDQSTLIDNGGGNYNVGSFGPNANGGNSVPFNELELYLMGMIPASDVSNFDVFADITSLTINTDDFDFEASSRTTYTPASLEALLGTRVPGSTTAQKDFNALIVVLTDAPLTTAEWDVVDNDAERFSRTESDGSTSYNFWEATNQLGTIDFSIDCNVTGIDTRIECDSLVWLDGNTYTTNNNTATHTITGGAANGCDSMVTLELTILHSGFAIDVATSCESYIWIDGNTYTSNNNTATHVFVGGAANGCDSVITLDLTILHGTTGEDIVTACDAYIWIDGITYTSSNNTAMHTITGGAANGCDSVVTLDLTILPSASGVDVQSACDVYTWIDGVTYTSSNNTAMYTIIAGAANSCDSLVMLDLTIIEIDASVTVVGPEITANMSGATYRWLKCDPGAGYIVIDGETSQSYTPTSTNNYAVEVTYESCVDTSECVRVTITSISQVFEEDKLRIYPNPTNGKFTVRIESSHVYIKEVTLHNSIGQTIFKYQTNTNQSTYTHDLTSYPAGIYFALVKNSIDQLAIRKIIVH